MKALLFLLFISITSHNLLACSCRKLPKLNREEINSAKNIFIGKVLKIEQVDHRTKKVILQIIERLKTDSITQITIWTGLGGADCGLNIIEGQQWYIFAYADSDDRSWAGLCGRNSLL